MIFCCISITKQSWVNGSLSGTIIVRCGNSYIFDVVTDIIWSYQNAFFGSKSLQCCNIIPEIGLRPLFFSEKVCHLCTYGTNWSEAVYIKIEYGIYPGSHIKHNCMIQFSYITVTKYKIVTDHCYNKYVGSYSSVHPDNKEEKKV